MDYRPPSGRFEIPSGSRRACLSIEVESDSLFEDEETLDGSLVGVVTSAGTVTASPERITIDPSETEIFIADDAADG